MRHSLIAIILTSVLIPSQPVAADTPADIDKSSDSPFTAHSVSMDFRPSWVVPTNSYLRGDETGERNITGAISPHLRYSFKFSPHTKEGRLYPHTYQGIGISYTQFIKKPSLGHPTTLYLFQGSRIASISPRLSFDYEWNFGASAGWKKFNPLDNPSQGPIGSKVNAYINLSFMLSYQINSQWKFTAGVDGTHYSNGNTHLPNAGVNLLGARIGMAYTFGEDKTEIRPTEATSFKPGIGYDLTVYGATRQRVYFPSDEALGEYIPGDFGVVGMNFSPMYSFNRYLRAGVSADFQYDESANISKYHVNGTDGEYIKFYRQPFKERFSAGLSLHAELTMPIFSINIGVGRNLIASGPDTRIFYQTLALKAYVIKGAYLQAGYQLRNFHQPNNLMLGIGYTFGRK